MHTVIYALVTVPDQVEDSEDEAFKQANLVFDQLVGVGMYNDVVFHYYDTFESNTSAVSGSARWGELPAVSPIDSEKGARLLYNGWKATLDSFENTLSDVRKQLDAFSDEEIMADKNYVRFNMRSLGEYEGPDIKLYSGDIGSIRCRKDLDYVLSETENTWIVPADVHY